MPRHYDNEIVEAWVKEVSKFRTFNFFVGDVVSFNYGFGCKEKGIITYVGNCSKGFSICVNGSYYGVEEPEISQVQFLELSPARMSGMKVKLVEGFALWILKRFGFFDRHGNLEVVNGIRLSTYRVGR